MVCFTVWWTPTPTPTPTCFYPSASMLIFFFCSLFCLLLSWYDDIIYSGVQVYCIIPRTSRNEARGKPTLQYWLQQCACFALFFCIYFSILVCVSWLFYTWMHFLFHFAFTYVLRTRFRCLPGRSTAKTIREREGCSRGPQRRLLAFPHRLHHGARRHRYVCVYFVPGTVLWNIILRMCLFTLYCQSAFAQNSSTPLSSMIVVQSTYQYVLYNVSVLKLRITYHGSSALL